MTVDTFMCFQYYYAFVGWQYQFGVLNASLMSENMANVVDQSWLVKVIVLSRLSFWFFALLTVSASRVVCTQSYPYGFCT